MFAYNIVHLTFSAPEIAVRVRVYANVHRRAPTTEIDLF